MKLRHIKLFVNIGLLFLFGIVFSGCVIDSVYKVSFTVDKEVVAIVEVNANTSITKEQVPADPVKEGYDFAGWFNGATELDFTTTINANATYEAKFDKKVFNVKFVVEKNEIASFDVEWGNVLDNTKVPTAPEKVGYNFLGWYCGETLFDATQAIKENKEVVAKYGLKDVFNISFVANGETIKTVQVTDGETVDPAEVPADPNLKAHKFVGWYNGDAEFDETAKVVANATYEAKFELTHYVATFEEQEVLVEVGSKLSIATIENPVMENHVFVGWYCGDVKATEGMDITNNMAFVAKFVGLESYNGTWCNENGVYFIIEDGEVLGGDFRYAQAFTFNTENGKIVYDEDGWFRSIYSFEVTSTGLKFTHDYYDSSYEENVIDEINLAKATQSPYQGSYRFDNSRYINIIEGGIVTEYNGSDTEYGIIKEVEGQLVIVYKAAYSSEKTVNVAIDEKGNIVAEGKIFVKNSTEFNYLYCSSENPYYYFFTVNEEQVIVADDNGQSYYASVEGSVEVGSIIIVKYNEKEVMIKITDTSHYELAGEEKGTYTKGTDTLVLNGFGNATLNDVEAEYTINGAGYIIINDSAYSLDAQTNTFTDVAKDNAIKGPFTLVSNSNYSQYKFVFDGFKGVSLLYITSSRTTEYNGTYELKEGSININLPTYSYYGGLYKCEDEGKILIKDDKIYILDGHTVKDIRENMDGSYGENGEIVVNSASSSINYNGQSYELTYNYNGSAATFEVASENPNISAKDIITIKLNDKGNLELVKEINVFDYDGYLVLEKQPAVEYAPYKVATLDAFAGTWKGKMSSGTECVCVINGDGTGTFNGNSFTYTVSGNKLSFVLGGEDYSLNGDPSTGKLTVQYTYDYSDMPEYDVTKQ